jgi:hypothetical protein
MSVSIPLKLYFWNIFEFLSPYLPYTVESNSELIEKINSLSLLCEVEEKIKKYQKETRAPLCV